MCHIIKQWLSIRWIPGFIDTRIIYLPQTLPRDHGNVSDCTGCQNLSNPTHQGTTEMCQIVQDARTCLIRRTKGPGNYKIYLPCAREHLVIEFVDNRSSTTADWKVLLLLSLLLVSLLQSPFWFFLTNFCFLNCLIYNYIVIRTMCIKNIKYLQNNKLRNV
jgi:hypothetical protein